MNTLQTEVQICKSKPDFEVVFGKLNMRFGSVILYLTLLSAGEAAHAKVEPAQSPFVRALANCRAETNDASRLRCYDAAAGALTAAHEQGELVVMEQQDLRTARRALFGFSLPKLPFFGGDQSAAAEQDEVSAQIDSVRSLGYGKWRIKLVGGAVWETTEASSLSMNPPSAGNAIVIKRGSLGSYILRIGGQRGLRGKRVS